MLHIADGDWDEFDRFVARYTARLLGLIRARVFDHHLAEDVAQEVLLRVDRATRTGRCRSMNGSMVPWVFTIARNCVTDLQRQRQRRPLSLASNVADDPIRPVVRCVATDTGPDPLEAVLQAESDQRVRTLLQRLPEAQRCVVSMKVFDQLSFVQIAHKVGCPLPTVKSRMRYGLMKLGDGLAGERARTAPWTLRFKRPAADTACPTTTRWPRTAPLIADPVATPA